VEKATFASAQATIWPELDEKNPNQLTRELVMGALNRHAHFHVVASATTAQEVLEAAQSAHVDVALIAPALADGPLSGLGVLRQICESSPQVKSVILFETH
jgi:DNA-binding NarL/FixJ family response regulator